MEVTDLEQREVMQHTDGLFNCRVCCFIPAECQLRQKTQRRECCEAYIGCIDLYV